MIVIGQKKSPIPGGTGLNFGPGSLAKGTGARQARHVYAPKPPRIQAVFAHGDTLPDLKRVQTEPATLHLCDRRPGRPSGCWHNRTAIFAIWWLDQGHNVDPGKMSTLPTGSAWLAAGHTQGEKG